MPVNITINELAHSVFKKTVEECSLDELQQLAHRYPYFGPAQLLLARKLQEENSPLYEEQVQRTSLYFPNRVWLHHLLNNQTGTEIPESSSSVKEEKAITGDPSPFVEPVVNENKETEAIPEIPPLKIEPLAPGAALTFEPYHTVDYFASQGIKFKEEEKPTDRFSQQLRSFTEWLRTMKRLPASEIPVITDAARESKVEQMAEHSIAERHVITEAMAEVWIKQGNRDRAEEIYRKLSLLDPLKSSYFAAKIEELKKTS